MKKVLVFLISIVILNTFVFTVLLLSKVDQVESTITNETVKLNPITLEESSLSDGDEPLTIEKEDAPESSVAQPLNISTTDSTDETLLLKYDYYYNEQIENSFFIQTLQEKYGDQLSEYVYLDETVIHYDDLRYLNVLHLGYDGNIHQGEIIVNAKVAEEVLKIFRELYDIGYPIEQMKVISYYGGSDTASMEANNTSGFNFRKMTSGEKLSQHAYGLAIDLNPVVNPYIHSGVVLPANGALYVDRSKEELGMIKKDDVVYEIFKRYGWTWGGDWNSPKDYQHFEKIIH